MKYVFTIIGGIINGIVAILLGIPVWIAVIFFIIGMITVYARIILYAILFLKNGEFKGL